MSKRKRNEPAAWTCPTCGWGKGPPRGCLCPVPAPVRVFLVDVELIGETRSRELIEVVAETGAEARRLVNTAFRALVEAPADPILRIGNEDVTVRMDRAVEHTAHLPHAPACLCGGCPAGTTARKAHAPRRALVLIHGHAVKEKSEK